MAGSRTLYWGTTLPTLRSESLARGLREISVERLAPLLCRPGQEPQRLPASHVSNDRFGHDGSNVGRQSRSSDVETDAQRYGVSAWEVSLEQLCAVSSNAPCRHRGPSTNRCCTRLVRSPRRNRSVGTGLASLLSCCSPRTEETGGRAASGRPQPTAPVCSSRARPRESLAF